MLQVNGPVILKLWERARDFPGGKKVFHLLMKQMIPYTGALGAEVLELKKGQAKVQLVDRRGVRNHLSSVHAMALANLAEFATGLALTTSLPAGRRGILRGFQIEYLKKSRGVLTAVSEISSEIFDLNIDKQDVEVKGQIQNSEQETVAEVKALWRISQEKI